MGLSRIFWDTNLFIYLIEQTPQLHDRVYQLRQDMLARGDELVSSTLTLAELLTQPLRSGNHGLARRYRDIFLSGALIVVPLDTAVAELVAEIRSTYNVKTPDAIQLASAAYMKVAAFYTSDRTLWRKKIRGIENIVWLE